MAYDKEKSAAYYKKHSERYKANRDKNKVAAALRGAKHYKENKEKISIKNKKNYKENKELYAEANRGYYKKNKLEMLKNSKRYRIEHQEELNEYWKKYAIERREKDSNYRVKHLLRNLIHNSFKCKGYKKTSKTFLILGISYDKLIEYLNTNEYGLNVFDNDIDIDHIIPISKGVNKEEIISLCHYTNLQLLPSDYNRYIKRDFEWDKNHFEDWLKINNKN